MFRRPSALLCLVTCWLAGCARAAVVDAPAAPPATPSPSPSPPSATPAPPPPPPRDPLGIAPDAVAESLLVDLASVDSAIRVEVRYATPYNFTGATLPGYAAPRALLRHEAAAALTRVRQRLHAEGLGLKVFDAYRPARATAAMVDWTRRVRREDLLRDGYVAERDAHNLGLAVDVTLVELSTARELKMGTAFDTFAPASRTANANGEAGANRQRLVRAMAAEGFANEPTQWWHYSYALPDAPRFDLVIR